MGNEISRVPLAIDLLHMLEGIQSHSHRRIANSMNVCLKAFLIKRRTHLIEILGIPQKLASVVPLPCSGSDCR